MQFLGIEIGHAATRVVALDLEAARVAAEATAAHGWVEGLPDGHREQDPAAWISAVDQAMRQCLADLGDARGGVAGIGITAPSGGMVVLDESNRIIRPAKLGVDRSAQKQADEIARAFGGAPGLIELAGNPVEAGSLAAQCLWLKQHEPYHFQRAARLMTPQDFIGYWLTGESGIEAGSAATTGLFDVPQRQWCGELLDFIDSRLPEMLPAGISPSQPRGQLRPALCSAWGLPASVIVAPGSGAAALAALSVGAAADGAVVADLSADGSLTAISDRPAVDFRGEATTLCDASGRWLSRLGMSNAVAALELVRRHYGWSGAEFENALGAAAAGADGLLFLPYLRGESTPRLPDASGVLHGLTLDNFTPGNLARAAAEGLALGFGYAFSRLGDLGFEPQGVRVTRDAGPAFQQLLADVFGVPVVAVAGTGGPLLGAAMQAAVVYFRLNGETLGFDEIAGYVVTADESTRREPDPEKHEFYGSLLARQQYLVETLHSGGFL
ncbi:FGGY family carbohydrate kinase [Luteolibacter marinus]|uniref:FGGY family carbohydrate kinase n=1 Tax=Luteolibacter marinus TaxID=2776705 RepID=UPI001866DFDF|nr:FGGY family carbohydrate kinase [Luteolibacter marinus]